MGVWAIFDPSELSDIMFSLDKAELMAHNMTARRDIFNKAGDPIVHTTCRHRAL